MKYILHLLGTSVGAMCMAFSDILQVRQTAISSRSVSCFYDPYDCHVECADSPIFSRCQQSIDSVCAYVAAATPNGTNTRVSYETGILNETISPDIPPEFLGSSNESSKGNCVASLIVSDSLTQFPSDESCHDSFQSILTSCADDTRAYYNSSCIGGAINLEGCSNQILDPSQPVYILGSPVEVGLQTPHAPGNLSQGPLVQVFFRRLYQRNLPLVLMVSFRHFVSVARKKLAFILCIEKGSFSTFSVISFYDATSASTPATPTPHSPASTFPFHSRNNSLSLTPSYPGPHGHLVPR